MTMATQYQITSLNVARSTSNFQTILETATRVVKKICFKPRARLKHAAPSSARGHRLTVDNPELDQHQQQVDKNLDKHQDDNP